MRWVGTLKDLTVVYVRSPQSTGFDGIVLRGFVKNSKKGSVCLTSLDEERRNKKGLSIGIRN